MAEMFSVNSNNNDGEAAITTDIDNPPSYLHTIASFLWHCYAQQETKYFLVLLWFFALLCLVFWRAERRSRLKLWAHAMVYLLRRRSNVE